MNLEHPALPPPVSRPWMVTALLVWVFAVLVSVIQRPPPLDPGPTEGVGRLITDPLEGRYGSWVLAETDVGVLLFDLGEPIAGNRGALVRFRGDIRSEPGRRGPHVYRARLRVRTLEVVKTESSVPVEVGVALRERVIDRLEPFDGGRGLLAGFLIGDTSEVDPTDVEAMRLSGLSHFVAVSGSNVALFLGLLAVAAGPLALGPRRRAVVGLLGLPVYAAATRFEPSVMRASVMAAMALGGRLLGVVFEAWQLLSLAVIVLLIAEPGLTGSVGFQLSVAATAGVLVGARWRVHGKVARALAITAGAQLAVAPLILMHFGSVPLMSPLVNLIAAPVVAASTLVGAVGVAGPGILIDVGSWLAGLVLLLARGASVWPQLAGGPLAVLMMAGLVFFRWSWVRVPLAIVGAVAVLFLVLGRGANLPDPGVVVLDVGQGDAILIHGGDGHSALVDGGPDAAALRERLRKYGVTRLDLVVLSHVHADHATGLTGLIGHIPIGELWERTDPHETEASRRLLMAAEQHGIPVVNPEVGDRIQMGDLALTVEGPLRSYASPNDQSIVIGVHGVDRSMLLAGDIETFAQADLDDLRADVLKVPHQGAGTSDPVWLESVEAELAVISVGPNSFGHPVDWVIETLDGAGAGVVRTDEVGDVVVPLG